MSVTTPLTTLADDQATAAQDTVTALRSTLRTRDAALPGIRQQQQTATTALTADALLEADLRRQLGAIDMPADSEPIVTRLEAVLVTEQGDRAAAARASDTLDDAVRARAATAAEFADATAMAVRKAAAAAAEHADADRVESWLAAAASAPVTQAVTGAAAATSEDPHDAAEARLKGILDTAASGTTMFDLFARRADEAAERAEAPADSAAAALSARQALLAIQSPATGALAEAETAYLVQEARLQDLAENAVTGLAAAVATLAAIAAAPPPTEAETGAITAAVDDAKTLAPFEVAVHDANRAVREGQATFDAAVWSHIADDPEFDGATSADVATERNALSARRSALQDAVDAFSAAGPEHLDTYEAAIPDETKDQVVTFFGARQILARIAGYGTGVPAAVQAAATALAAARNTFADEESSAARLDRVVADLTATSAARATVADSRSAALVRGEGALR